MTVFAALERLYDREIAQGSLHYSDQPVDFVLVIDRGGRVYRVEDRRHFGEKVRSGSAYAPTLPRRSGKTPAANLFWDKSDFVLGVGPAADAKAWKGKPLGKGKDEAAAQAEIAKCHETARAYRARFVEANLPLLKNAVSPALVAFRTFLTRWEPEYFELLVRNDEVRDSWVMIAYEEDGDLRLIHEEPEAIAIVEAAREDADLTGVCLVSGRHGPIARIQQAANLGLKDKLAISSFNEDAFTSHGWERGANAPFSKRSSIAVTEALSHLVKTGRSIRIGDEQFLFWAEASGGDVEEVDLLLAACLGARSASDMEAESVTTTRETLRRILAGEPGAEEAMPSDVTVRTLLIGANTNRAIIRSMGETGLRPFLETYKTWLSDLIILGPKQPATAHWQLSRCFAAYGDQGYKYQRDGETIQVVRDAQAAFLKASLSEGRLPNWMLPQLFTRISRDGHLGPDRIAVINAAIRRSWRAAGMPTNNNEKGYLMADAETMHPAWHAGRIFALLERAQDNAIGNSGAGVAVKFLGQAASRPASVLPRLVLSARQRHLPKLLSGRTGAKWMRGKPPALLASIGRSIEADLAQSIVDAGPLPLRFSPEEQGIFLIGYYTERTRSFAKTTEEDNLVVIEETIE